MIFYSEKLNMDIDLTIKENIVVEQWNIDSSAQKSTTLVGLEEQEAIRVLKKQGFRRCGDLDPF